MRKLTKTIKIHFEVNECLLSLGYVPNKSLVLNCKELLHSFKNGCLVERKHSFMQTQFDLSDCTPCLLVIFDENKLFVTIKPIFKKPTAPLSFFISDPYVFIIPPNTNMINESILSFEFINNIKN